MGKVLIVLGFVIVVLGVLVLLGEKFPHGYRNPLDFSFKKGNFSFYFPLGSSILISILLSLLFYLFRK